MSKTGIALIGAAATILGSIISAYAGFNAGETNEREVTGDLIAEVVGNNINVAGDGNNVTINDAASLANEYMELRDEYESLQGDNSYLVSENKSYSDELTAANKTIADLTSNSESEINSLKAQIESFPVIEYKDLSLCVDTLNIPINSIGSSVTIDGREYFSRDIIESLIADNKAITIKDGTIFIGNVIKDQKSLYDVRVLDQYFIEKKDSLTDSYGNNYSQGWNCSSHYQESVYSIFYTNQDYSYLRLTVAIKENTNMGETGTLIIKADDETVYTLDKMDKLMEPVTITDIPINKCNRLTITYNSHGNYIDCIISDAMLYN